MADEAYTQFSFYRNEKEKGYKGCHEVKNDVLLAMIVHSSSSHAAQTCVYSPESLPL